MKRSLRFPEQKTCPTAVPLRAVLTVVATVSLMLAVALPAAAQARTLAGQALLPGQTATSGVAVRAFQGADTVRTSTDGEGRFTLLLPRPGEWSVEAEAFGWSASTEVVVGEADSALLMNLSPAPLEIVGVDVEAARECPVFEDAGTTSAQRNLLDLARTMADWTRTPLAETTAVVATTIYDQSVLLEEGWVGYTDTWTLDGVDLEPDRRGSLAYRDTLTVPLSFALPLLDEVPPAGTWVTWPDPDVLATYRLPSPNLVTTVDFLERYCWGPATDAGAGTQGLAFRPRQITGGQPDLWGILWFPSDGTGEWALEARYTDFLPTDVVEIDHGVEWHPNLFRPAIPLRNDRRFINRVEWTVDAGAVRHPDWVRLHYPTPRNVLYQFYAPEYVRKAGLHGPPPPLQRGDTWQEPIWAGTVVRRTEFRVIEAAR